MALSTREWGRGAPVVALHPLGLESSAFAGFGRVLAESGLRTVAVDLPGFGRSPQPGGPLTPTRLAEPVIELARELETPPALLGISMGGRVALEAALTAPEAFRCVVAVAPFLPWLRLRWAMPLARLLSPTLAERLPLELLWPLLKGAADTLARVPRLEHDELAQAAVRAIYYSSCPATRASTVSAAREMALEPALGPAGLWERLAGLRTRSVFIWSEHDRLVPVRFAHRLRRVLPGAVHKSFPCGGHALNGPHQRCLAEAVASILGAGDAGGHGDAVPGRVLAALPCRVVSARSAR